MSYNRGRQGGAQGGTSSYIPPGDRTATEKRSRTCVDWNTSGCSRKGKDYFHCGWGAKHFAMVVPRCKTSNKNANSKSALVYGERVADSLQDWIKEGIAFGPLLPEEMPWTDYSVNPILVRLKPNGKARIIVNMSSPYPKESDKKGDPKSVNSGINKEDFPATMSLIAKFAQSLMHSG